MADCLVLFANAGTDPTSQQLLALNRAIWDVFPHVPNYWQEVARRVPGKSAEQCQAQLNVNDMGGKSPHGAAKAARSTASAAGGVKRKAASMTASKDAKRARAEHDGGHTSEDDFQTKPKPKSGAAGADQANSDTSSSDVEEDEDEEDEAGSAPDGQQTGSSKAPMLITAHKGTIKRRRQLRELLQQARYRRHLRRTRNEQVTYEKMRQFHARGWPARSGHRGTRTDLRRPQALHRCQAAPLWIRRGPPPPREPPSMLGCPSAR